MARSVALVARVGLGLSGPPVHEPVHTGAVVWSLGASPSHYRLPLSVHMLDLDGRKWRRGTSNLQIRRNPCVGVRTRSDQSVTSDELLPDVHMSPENWKAVRPRGSRPHMTPGTVTPWTSPPASDHRRAEEDRGLPSQPLPRTPAAARPGEGRVRSRSSFFCLYADQHARSSQPRPRSPAPSPGRRVRRRPTRRPLAGAQERRIALG